MVAPYRTIPGIESAFADKQAVMGTPLSATYEGTLGIEKVVYLQRKNLAV